MQVLEMINGRLRFCPPSPVVHPFFPILAKTTPPPYTCMPYLAYIYYSYLFYRSNGGQWTVGVIMQQNNMLAVHC